MSVISKWESKGKRKIIDLHCRYIKLLKPNQPINSFTLDPDFREHKQIKNNNFNIMENSSIIVEYNNLQYAKMIATIALMFHKLKYKIIKVTLFKPY